MHGRLILQTSSHILCICIPIEQVSITNVPMHAPFKKRSFQATIKSKLHYTVELVYTLYIFFLQIIGAL